MARLGRGAGEVIVSGSGPFFNPFFNLGTAVSVQAVANASAGYQFSGWTGHHRDERPGHGDGQPAGWLGRHGAERKRLDVQPDHAELHAQRRAAALPQLSGDHGDGQCGGQCASIAEQLSDGLGRRLDLRHRHRY